MVFIIHLPKSSTDIQVKDLPASGRRLVAVDTETLPHRGNWRNSSNDGHLSSLCFGGFPDGNTGENRARVDILIGIAYIQDMKRYIKGTVISLIKSMGDSFHIKLDGGDDLIAIPKMELEYWREGVEYILEIDGDGKYVKMVDNLGTQECLIREINGLMIRVVPPACFLDTYQDSKSYDITKRALPLIKKGKKYNLLLKFRDQCDICGCYSHAPDIIIDVLEKLPDDHELCS